MEEERRKLQVKHEAEYQKALVEIKDEIHEIEGDEIVEKMKEDVRQWFVEDKDETGKFPDYPSEDEGGSGAVFHPELQPDYEENGANINEPEKEEAASKEKKKGGSKEEKGGAGGASGGDKKGKEDDDEEGIKLTESEFIKGLKNADKNFVGKFIFFDIQ